jgi:hypothetical protein
VLDDLGRNGRIWREADAETADLETVVQDLLTGEYKKPERVVALNTVEEWSRVGRRRPGTAPTLRPAGARCPVFPVGFR